MINQYVSEWEVVWKKLGAVCHCQKGFEDCILMDQCQGLYFHAHWCNTLPKIGGEFVF